MQDKFPIIVYGEDGTHITELLLDLCDLFLIHDQPPAALFILQVSGSGQCAG